MSDLAYNINGEAFDVPDTATGWRVRRMKPRGAPEVVYGRDGVPLSLSIEADLEDLRRAVDAPGRFRLDAIDDHGKTLSDLPAAYVVVSHREDVPALVEAAKAPALEGSSAVVAEAMRLNTELARAVIDRFPEMMTAAAELLRAADGAGLPARKPRELAGGEADDADEDDDDRDAPATSPTFELINTLVAQVVPLVVTSLASKKMPKLGAILDWRKAAPQAQPAQLPTETTASAEPADETEELPPLDPKMMSHFIAIQSALTPAEAALARQIAAELSPKEMRAWFAELSALSVPDAVAKIRAFVGQSKAGGAA